MEKKNWEGNETLRKKREEEPMFFWTMLFQPGGVSFKAEEKRRPRLQQRTKKMKNQPNLHNAGLRVGDKGFTRKPPKRDKQGTDLYTNLPWRCIP